MKLVNKISFASISGAPPGFVGAFGGLVPLYALRPPGRYTSLFRRTPALRPFLDVAFALYFNDTSVPVAPGVLPRPAVEP